MKHTVPMLFACLLPSAALAQGTPGTAGGPINHNDARVHPGFSMTSLVPAGSPANWPRVGGMDFLPNGDLVVSTWDGFGNASGTTRPGRVFIFKNVVTGDSSLVTYSQFGANNMNEPLGLKVSDGEIYIIEKDSLVHLVDADKNQVLDAKQRVAGGWSRTFGDNSGKDLSFAHGLVRLPQPDGRFVAGLATRWIEPGAFNGGPSNSTAERGCIIGMSLTGPGYEPIACGIRSPDGIALGPEDGIFVTDNHGHYVPASKMVHVKQGRFFNVYKNQPSPFENATVTPPVLWLPHGNNLANISVSPTQPVYLRSGTFKGQMLAGDNAYGTLQRYFLEKVGGEYQGAVFRFSGGLRAAAHRLVQGPDSAVYIGGIGATGSEWGGWAWANRQAGLQRMQETGAPFFDVIAVRSTGAASFELEFTEPIVSADVENFPQVQQWNYTPQLAYGAGRGTTQNLTVVGVTVSDDKRRAEVFVSGLSLNHVVFLRWSGITSQSGRPLWSDRAWYTLNAFGPADPVSVRGFPGARAQRAALLDAKALPDGRIDITVTGGAAAPSAVQIRSLNGALLETVRPDGSGRLLSRAVYGPGVYLVTSPGGGAGSARRVAVH